MGHRIVKRVPLDFDAPLGKVWSGYVMPDDVRPPDCSDCEGTGYSPTARWLQSTFYAHNVASGVGGWGDKLTLTAARCERLGAESDCANCGGRAMVCTNEEYAAYENWTGSEPPEGEGWQLWETTSEGSPVSPIFDTDVELANWCAGNATPFADIRWTSTEWLESFRGGNTDADTLLVLNGSGERVSP